MSKKKKRPVVIETQLSQAQARKLAILSYLQRPTLFVHATLSAALTGYALLSNNILLLLLAWVPLALFLVIGLLSAVRGTGDPHAPHFLPTRYEVSDQGMTIITPQGQRQVGWQGFTKWKKMSECYVLFLGQRPLLAIPQASVAPQDVDRFEALLHKQIH